MASILLTPAATAVSLVILKCHISYVFFTCVPTEASIDCPKRIVLTVSLYFSPKRAIAPSEIACSWGTFLLSSKGICSLIQAFTNCSMATNSSVVSLLKWEKSKRNIPECTIEPFCSTWSPNIEAMPGELGGFAVWLQEVLKR